MNTCIHIRTHPGEYFLDCKLSHGEVQIDKLIVIFSGEPENMEMNGYSTINLTINLRSSIIYIAFL